MKLHQVTLAGFLAFAGFTAGVANDKAHIEYLDDGSNTYHCGTLDIYQCSILGSCSLYESCMHWCIDLEAPGGAVCADAPPKDVETRDEPNVAWNNDAEGKYICTGLNIEYCGLDGFLCSSVKHCNQGCFDTGHGALCVDMVTARARRLVQTNANTDSLSWPNSRYTTYICGPGNAVMVCTSTLPGQPCNVIAHCQGECSQSFEGVSCGQKSAISTRDETEATFVSAALGKCDGVQGKCYDCTDSHQGVLTCEYGFCYVEPKHWCANGWSCHDDCSCCKKDRKRGSENIRFVEAAPKNKRSADEVLHGMGVCNPGDYACHPTDYSWLIVCDANGNWQIAAYCGQNGIYGCCRGPLAPGPDHYCDCRPPTGELLASIEASDIIPEGSLNSHSTNTVEQATKAVQDTVADVPSAGCIHGTYRCRQPFVLGHLQVCGSDGVWQISNECCGPYTCVDPPGNEPPHCECSRKSRSISSVGQFFPGYENTPRSFNYSPTDLDSGPQDPDEPELCTPGRFTCGDRESKVYVCNFKGNWEFSDKCGSGTKCMRGEHHEAYCTGVTKGNGKTAAKSADSAPIGAGGKSATLVTVAKEAASTAKA